MSAPKIRLYDSYDGFFRFSLDDYIVHMFDREERLCETKIFRRSDITNLVVFTDDFAEFVKTIDSTKPFDYYASGANAQFVLLQIALNPEEALIAKMTFL